MYEILKERIEKLKEEEKQSGELKPELRETISVANALLKEIRLESSGVQETNEERDRRIFGDWVEKSKKRRGVDSD